MILQCQIVKHSLANKPLAHIIDQQEQKDFAKNDTIESLNANDKEIKQNMQYDISKEKSVLSTPPERCTKIDENPTTTIQKSDLKEKIEQLLDQADKLTDRKIEKTDDEQFKNKELEMIKGGLAAIGLLTVGVAVIKQIFKQ